MDGLCGSMLIHRGALNFRDVADVTGTKCAALHHSCIQFAPCGVFFAHRRQERPAFLRIDPTSPTSIPGRPAKIAERSTLAVCQLPSPCMKHHCAKPNSSEGYAILEIDDPDLRSQECFVTSYPIHKFVKNLKLNIS